MTGHGRASLFERSKAYRDARDALLHTFRKCDGKIFHFWSAEWGVDTVWPYLNLMDFTPEGRPNRGMPPQSFRPEFFEKYYLSKE